MSFQKTDYSQKNAQQDDDKVTSPFIKIGVFYDGNYFLHVSNYYNYVHERRNRISISGLHEFIRHQVAQREHTRTNLAQIVDAHYFRGRLNAKEASLRGNQLYYDRVFDDILMSAGVVTHYFPLRNLGWKREEKGVDVWLALEAFELSMYKKFDVVVLIASDGDYVPLVRKLNTLGIRVMILGWDFEYTNHDGKQVVTRTSHDLLAEASYPLLMSDVIDARVNSNRNLSGALINSIFVAQESQQTQAKVIEVAREETGEVKYQSEVLSMKNGYGFIKYPNNNLFFYHEDVEDIDFNELREGDEVEFTVATNQDGKSLAKNVRRID